MSGKGKQAAKPAGKPTDVITFTIKVIGGEPKSSTLAPKCGGSGMPLKVLEEDVRKATAEYKGNRCYCRVTIQDRKATVEVLQNASVMIIKALREPPHDRKKTKNIKHDGNLKLSEIIDMARIHQGRIGAKTLKASVKCILGTCLSVGCKIDNRGPKEILNDINQEAIMIPEN